MILFDKSIKSRSCLLKTVKKCYNFFIVWSRETRGKSNLSILLVSDIKVNHFRAKKWHIFWEKLLLTKGTCFLQTERVTGIKDVIIKNVYYGPEVTDYQILQDRKDQIPAACPVSHVVARQCCEQPVFREE